MNRPNLHGLLVLDKPLGMTSRAAVDKALRWFPRGTRLGHTGTLDPLATGVLVLTVGHATRLTEYVQDMGKTYVADVTLGAHSATDDAEGPVTPVPVERPPARIDLDAVLPEFIGEVCQVPPAYSAAKVTGRRAYALARRGVAVALAPRPVRIDGVDVLEYEYPHLRLEVRCGKGTYIRSLARDLGERLGCGAYLSALRRTRVGPFTPADAVPLDADADTACSRLQPLTAAVAGLPHIALAPAQVMRLRHGQPIELSAMSPPAHVPPGTPVAVVESSGALAAVAATDRTGQFLRPVKVFPSDPPAQGS